MPKTRRPYPVEFRAEMVRLVRAGRSPGALSREFEPSEQTIRNWVNQADVDQGTREGLTTAQLGELRHLRRENRILREEKKGFWQKQRPGVCRAESVSTPKRRLRSVKAKSGFVSGAAHVRASGCARLAATTHG